MVQQALQKDPSKPHVIVLYGDERRMHQIVKGLEYHLHGGELPAPVAYLNQIEGFKEALYAQVRANPKSLIVMSESAAASHTHFVAQAMDDSYASVEVMSLEPVPSHETVFILTCYRSGDFPMDQNHSTILQELEATFSPRFCQRFSTLFAVPAQWNK